MLISLTSCQGTSFNSFAILWFQGPIRIPFILILLNQKEMEKYVVLWTEYQTKSSHVHGGTGDQLADKDSHSRPECSSARLQDAYKLHSEFCSL